MSIKQKANIKLYFKLGKKFQWMQQVNGDEWYTRLKNGREDTINDCHIGQLKFVIRPEIIEKVRHFLNIQP